MDNQHILTDDEVARRRRIQGTYMNVSTLTIPQYVFVVMCGDEGDVDVFFKEEDAWEYAHRNNGLVYKRKIRG